MAKLHKFCILFLACFFVSDASFITHLCSSVIDESNRPSFQASLMHTFSDLASASSVSRSRHSSSIGPEIHASFHCWRSIPSQMACKKCVETATKSILRLCQGHQNATVWNSGCTLHYFTSNNHNTLSTYNFHGQERVPWAWLYALSNIDELTTQAHFNDALASIMSSLIDKATNNSRNFAPLHANGEVIVTDLDTLYGTVECSSSESPSSCKACLGAALARVSDCCGGSTAAEVILVSCRLGYDLGPSMSRASLVGPFSSLSFSDAVSLSTAKRKL